MPAVNRVRKMGPLQVLASIQQGVDGKEAMAGQKDRVWHASSGFLSLFSRRVSKTEQEVRRSRVVDINRNSITAITMPLLTNQHILQ